MSGKLHLEIPASTANLGVGFDSIGMALNKFLTLDVSEIEGSEWQFHHFGPHIESLPTDDTHYIYQVAQQVAKRYNVSLPALEIKMHSEIPLARGLGSSAAALVAALFIANYFGDIELSQYELLQLATEFEGHPDNVAPTIYGGLVLGYYNPDTRVTDVSYIDTPKVDIVITIPSYELQTTESRNALPDQLTHQQAVRNSAISNTMISALIQHNYALAGKMMGQDGFHEPYRQHLIPEFRTVKAMAKMHGAYATVISGAGPTMLTMVPPEKSGELVRALKEKFKNCKSELVTINEAGVKQQIIYST
ncbi:MULTISPECIES: homoserine kinase [Staphylococcus]|uniref:Homoserine kinase n=1 Tax=Staphylococcus pettenkoferi TaxID=170573 RepID=A0A2N6QJZ6_9STAP|nr:MULTISPECIES: homoserine kinase [Staphylococcus]MBX8992590.1 homoserine kinase [Staphylococcus pettenkoferi]MCI2790307.1 homoserine kinase [Staphylococcus pettenkoferi]MCY1565969.1 homoserine kinase [Staphylococcus pettenkoferi]MCY1587154.1 homoserine kinase [Staphylococcus pettenkoferi]MCY1603662.1 homoserine kinase [Staphylococcus pettenkoferi]